MRHRIITVTLNPALDRTYTVAGFRIGELNKAQSVGIDAGGKGINVARTLKHFGLDALATGFNGGASGRNLESILLREKIPFHFYEVLGETRINTKISDIKTGITTELNEPGFYISEEVLAGFLKKLQELAQNAEYLVLSGSLPQGVPAGIYADLVTTYKKRGIKVILDADNEPLKLGASAAPFAVKPNLKELSCLAGRVLDTEADILLEARKLIEAGIEQVAVTMGARGLILLTSDGAYKAKPFPIKAACTTGAGDSTVAAFIYSIINCLPAHEIAAYMACAGTLSSALPGTASCGLEDIKKNVSRIQIEQIY